MSLKPFENFFKSTTRSAGYRAFAEGKVSLSQPSDTEIRAFIKASGGFKVSLKCQKVEDKTIMVDCSCPASKKGQLCKHIWAVFLEADKKSSDFFDGKNDIQKMTFAEQPKFKSQSTSRTPSDSKAAFKAKQDAYRKEQYQKQKQRMKDFKQAQKKSREPEPSYPKNIETALEYFSQNGFPMEANWNHELVGAARKKLSRIFHPDVGGSHAEIVELNKHADALLRYLDGRN